MRKYFISHAGVTEILLQWENWNDFSCTNSALTGHYCQWLGRGQGYEADPDFSW